MNLSFDINTQDGEKVMKRFQIIVVLAMSFIWTACVHKGPRVVQREGFTFIYDTPMKTMNGESFAGSCAIQDITPGLLTKRLQRNTS